jgi:hypothetical protein
MGPAGTVARAADAREAIELPGSAVAIERRIAAQLALVEDLFELGDRDGARRALAAARALVADFPHAYWRWATESWGVLDALIDGRLDEVEALAGCAFAQAGGEHPEAVEAFGVQLTNLRLLQRKSGEVIDLLRDAADTHPHIPCYRAVLALCCAESGDDDGAGVAFDALAAHGDDFGAPPDSNWLMTVALLADVAATLHRRDAAAPLLALLEPYGDRQVVLNCYGGGGAHWGPVAYHLARLYALLGDDDVASAWRRRAIAAADAFASPWVQWRDDVLAASPR